MGSTDKVTRTMKCDNCGMEIEYNPVLTPASTFPAKLKDFVAISDMAAGYETIYCGDGCAVEAIGKNRHRKTTQLTVPSREEAARAVSASETLKKMRLQ